MSFLTDKTQTLVEAVQAFEAKAQELIAFRGAIEAAHKDLGELLSPAQAQAQPQEAQPEPEQPQE